VPTSSSSEVSWRVGLAAVALGGATRRRRRRRREEIPMAAFLNAIRAEQALCF
jgi:MYXO-CTERM domain-containing protein